MKHEPIKKEMLINVLQPEECRIAIVENGVLEELYVERTSQESYVGNIYKGRIVNIEPSIQAAFVDFGVGRNGFLHVSDVDPVYYRNKAHRRSDDLQDVLNLQEFEVPDLSEEEFVDETGDDVVDDEFEDRLSEDAVDSDAPPDEADLATETPERLESDYVRYEDDLGMEVDYEGQPPRPEDRPLRRGRGRGRGRGRRGPRHGGNGPRAGGRDSSERRHPPRASRGSIGYFGRDPEDYRRFGASVEGLETVPISEPPASSTPPSLPEPSVNQMPPPEAEISPLPADLTPDYTETSLSEPAPETSTPPAKARQRRPRYTSRPIPPADAVLDTDESTLPSAAERSRRTSRRQSKRPSLSPRVREENLETDEEEISPKDEIETTDHSAVHSREGTELVHPKSDLNADELAIPDEDQEAVYAADDQDEQTDMESSPRRILRDRTPRSERNRPRSGRGSLRDKPPIQEIFRRGQEVLVQVIKEGLGTKGPTLSTYISIPGRYLVLMPGLQRIGVSRKITDELQRNRLRQMLRDMELPPGLGFIVRTAGLDRTRSELVRDLQYLSRLWQVIVRRVKKANAPTLVYEENDIITRTIRDVFTSEIESIQVDEPKAFEHAREFMAYVMPRYAHRIHLDTGSEPLFHRYGIEQEIARIQERRIPLPGGGSIVIDQTEALVAIDVNSGNHRVDNNAEETAFRVNLAAAKEIARQLRLRDLGGVIVIDFIDMRSESHRRQVENALREALRRDRARTKALRMSQFGIVEMTRQRIRPSLARSNFTECPTCRGKGMIKTTESLSIEVMRLLQLAAFRGNLPRVQVRVAEPVAQYLLNQKRRHIAVLEERGQMSVTIFGVPGVSPEFLEVTCHESNGGEIKLTDAAAMLPAPRSMRSRSN